jgi:hypothetical protein
MASLTGDGRCANRVTISSAIWCMQTEIRLEGRRLRAGPGLERKKAV